MVSQKQINLDIKQYNDRINFNTAKIQEFDQFVPLMVKDQVQKLIRDHFYELDRTKVDRKEFNALC